MVELSVRFKTLGSAADGFRIVSHEQAIAKPGFRLSRLCHNSQRVSSQGQPGAAGRDPESSLFRQLRTFLDPGSRPAARDLAGMTNCHTVSFAGMTIEADFWRFAISSTI